MLMKSTAEGRTAPLTIGAHPVLDFLNTVPMIEGRLQEQLQTEADVLSTLKHLGWTTRYEGTGLLAATIELREEVRRLVARRKDGKSLSLTKLNEFLVAGVSHIQLRKSKDGSFTTEKIWECKTAQQALIPLAEASADLLANGDFSLIRRCESEQCVLWFYDRTKSHHRRWCSVSTCGNRHKVAAFRQRQLQSG